MRTIILASIMAFLAVATNAEAEQYMERVVVTRNQFAMDLLKSKEYVAAEMAKIHEVAAENGVTMEAQPVWVTSKEKTLPPDSGLLDAYNIMQKHEFLYTNTDQTWQCSFSVYILWQNTAPLSINDSYSEVTSGARCFQPE